MKTQTPQGVRDLLPVDVAGRRQVIDKLKKVFEDAGYQRIITPVLELYDTLKKGLSPDLQERAIKFIDRTGELMVLRPDMTTPIARVVASRMRDETKPIRLYYIENVFRKQKPEAGRDNEFYQVGIEMIGADSKEADEEILTLARQTLEAIGLRNVEIDTGDVNRFKDISDDKKTSLLKGDYVSYGELPSRDNLVVKDLDYYTGMVFECYVPEVGYLLGSGGRYDKLIGKFGLDRPAVGFAFNLEKVMLALKAQA
ncbi:ATP phosphoribosyltransferase regulatory subunit [Candidatus Margulisiibacteriota bacterium]